MNAPASNTEPQTSQQTTISSTVTIDGIVETNSILQGTLEVLNNALVPGRLSSELHNAKVLVQNMINGTADQIAKLKELGKVQNITEAKKRKKKKK